MKLNKYISMLMACTLTVSAGVLTSCDEDDDYDTTQIKGGVSLTAAQLQVTRGGYMQFKGSGLNQIESIIFPENVTVSEIETVDQYTIRCIVPEEAVEGEVILVYSGGELKTGEIAFTEPIEINEFAPTTITAGQELTISGRYLNYFTHITFATGEAVKIAPTRNEAKVTVPVDASTGLFTLSYITVEGTDTIENEYPSPDTLYVTGPSDITLPTAAVKSGQEITIGGKLLRLVETVKFQGAEVRVAQADPTKDIESIKLTVPETANAGEVTLVLLSGLEIPAGNIALVEPVAKFDSQKTYGVADKLVITGSDLDLVASVTFANAEAIEAAVADDGSITVEVPAAAQSGDITLTLKNGVQMAAAGFVTTKPTITIPDDAVTPLSSVTFDGTLLKRVTQVLFGEYEAVIDTTTQTETSITVTVPLDAATGALSVVMDNGETVAIGDINVGRLTACAITSFNQDAVPVGSLLSATVVNPSELVGVEFDGTAVDAGNYMIVGETFYTAVPNAPGTYTMTLVSKDSSRAQYSVVIEATGIVETVIWTGPLQITWNDGGRVILKASDFESVPAGSTLRFYFYDMDGAWCQAQINNGIWNNDQFGTLKPSEVPEYDWWNMEKNSEHIYDITLNAEALQHIAENVGDNGEGIIIQGSDMIFSKVSIIVDYSAPKPIWTGSFDNSGWAGNQDLGWGGYDWSTVKAGQTLYFTVSKVTAGSWGCLSLRHGDGWGALVDAPGQYDLGDDQDSAVIEFTLTQAAIDDLIANGGLIMTGDNLVVTQVAIK